MTAIANTDLTEQRIAVMARRAARIVISLRRAGRTDDAQLFEAFAMTVVNQMRKGEL